MSVPGADDPEEPERCFRLIYRSCNRIPDQRRDDELGTIFTQARTNNRDRGITGALLISEEDCFVQALEGDEYVVRSMFARIQDDPRHDAVSVIESGVEDRVFARWAMAKVSDDGETDIPILADRARGVVPAVRGTRTSDQESMLSWMRDVARHGTPA